MLYRNAECYIEMLYCYIAFFSYEMLPPKKKLIAVLLNVKIKIRATTRRVAFFTALSLTIGVFQNVFISTGRTI